MGAMSGICIPGRIQSVEALMTLTWSPEELCSQYSTAVSRFAALLAREPADAEDLAQDVLIKAIHALPRFNAERGSMDAWLWAIAVNAAKDRQRSDLRRLGLWRMLLRTPNPELESPESRAIRNLETARVRRSMQKLEPRERMLIALRYGADLDFESTGRATGISEDAARKATERSLRKLRALMENKP